MSKTISEEQKKKIAIDFYYFGMEEVQVLRICYPI
jgi:hypothetical protein